MNKCFITKLPSSVDNDNLPVLGQLRINWLKQSKLTDNDARAIALRTNDSITVNVSGAHFTDSTLTSNLGNTKTITVADGVVWLYVSNDADAVLTIDNKYSLAALTFIRPGKDGLARSAYFDIENIKYCTNMATLGLTNTQVSGDISALSNLTNLTYIGLASTQVNGDISALSKLTMLYAVDLSNNQVSGDINALSNLVNLTNIIMVNTQVSGDINALSKLTALTNIGFNRTQVSGDISALSNLTNLNVINFLSTQVSGDISALSKLTNIITLNLSNTQVSGDISVINRFANIKYITLVNTQVSGNIDSLASVTTLADFGGLEGTSLVGDMSKVPINVKYISQLNRKVTTNFTWTANGRKNATLLAMNGNVPFDTTSMDNMLVDQATCTFRPNAAEQWTKIISVSGTRTSASDAAVTAIQNMGVTITGVTKES